MVVRIALLSFDAGRGDQVGGSTRRQERPRPPIPPDTTVLPCRQVEPPSRPHLASRTFARLVLTRGSRARLCHGRVYLGAPCRCHGWSTKSDPRAATPWRIDFSGLGVGRASAWCAQADPSMALAGFPGEFEVRARCRAKVCDGVVVKPMIAPGGDTASLCLQHLLPPS